MDKWVLPGDPVVREVKVSVDKFEEFPVTEADPDPMTQVTTIVIMCTHTLRLHLHMTLISPAPSALLVRDHSVTPEMWMIG